MQVTSVVTTFVFRILQSAAVGWFLTQLQEVGFLVHWESLLSTYGDEIGMLEDFIIAIHDLNHLRFKVSVCVQSDVLPMFYMVRSLSMRL